MNREPCKTGFEIDAICARRIYKYTQKAGVCKKAKRQINRRARHAARLETQRAAPDLTGTAPNEGSAQGPTR